MMRTLLLALVVMVGPQRGWSAAEVPKTLTLTDLVGRPDRWPQSVVVAVNVRSKSGQSVLQGQKVPVVNVTDKGVFVSTTAGGQIGLFPNQCDLLEQANARWMQLTPAQRALDPETVFKDSSLWPDVVRMIYPTQISGSGGSKTVLPAGHLNRFFYFENGQVAVVPNGVSELKWFKPDSVDVVGGALERVILEPAERPSRLVEGVRNVMRDAAGKPYSAKELGQTRAFVFFWAANWCGWCHKVSPELARFVTENSRQLKQTTVVMLNGDKQDSEMLKYLREKNLPWPAIRQADWQRVPYFKFTHEGSFPQLLITDRYGRILYNGFGGGPENIRAHLAAMSGLVQGTLVADPSGEGDLGQSGPSVPVE